MLVFVLIAAYFWVAEAITWGYMLSIKGFIVLAYLDLQTSQFLYFLLGLVDRPDDLDRKEVETVLDQVVFWRLYRNYKGEILNLFSLSRYLVYFFCLIGVIAGFHTWTGLAVTVLVFNLLQFVDAIVARHLVGCEGGLRSQLIALLLERGKLTLCMVVLLGIYSYTESILQIVYLSQVCQPFLIFYYVWMLLCAFSGILIPEGFSAENLKLIACSVVGLPLFNGLGWRLAVKRESTVAHIALGILPEIVKFISTIVVLAYSIVDFETSRYGLACACLCFSLFNSLRSTAGWIIFRRYFEPDTRPES